MPSRQPSSFNHQRHKTTFIFLIISVFSSLLILFGVFYFLYYLWYSLIQRSRTSPLDSCPEFVKLRRFTFKELSSATNGFSDENSIGKGGSGTVFRGILKTGKLVAVKLLDSTSFQAEREFQNELRILGGLESEFIVLLLGYCIDKQNRLVVYEYMPNRSLQESLFSEQSSSSSLSWERRFEIILDVSRALAFLHRECDPPVIHGDVKPSNVLLDTEFRAKLSDFGLSRLKIESEFGVDLFSQDLSGTLAAGESPAIGTPVDSSTNEVDFALALQASSSSTPINSKVFCNHLKGLGLGLGLINDKGKEISINNDWNNNDESGCNTVDESHVKELNFNVDEQEKIGKKQWGKDWWWKQDGSGELCSKDYVREWIGSQICPSANPDWDDDQKNISIEHSSENHGVEIGDRSGWRPPPQHHRKMQEWWKEEHLDELTKKSVANKPKRLEKKRRKGFKMSFFRRIKRKQGQCDGGDIGPNAELSFRKSSKKNGCREGSEMWSGDVLSRELSSTTSMRGTLCYVAPEYGGCGYLMEKADIYSFGVLILVIVSGRRPLHVLASPMKLEKANLISWCRQLAQGGDLLELMDERLKDEYNKEQASLCINLALACLQKMPELRPDIGDIVKIMKGEMDLPLLPFEFSPSPPSKLVSKSRSRGKQKTIAD